MNGISNTFIPNTLSGLESINATDITINGQSLSSIFVPFINSPFDVDLADKNLTTSGRVQTTVLKLPSVTYSTTKVLRVKADKEVESVDLAPIYVSYTGAVSSLDMGSLHIYTTATPSSGNDVVNKTYTDATFPTFTFLSSNYLTQIDALNTYLTQIDAANIYLQQTVAASTYLTMASAGATYLTIANAGSTYATISNLNLKANSASPTFTGTVTLPAVNFTSTPSSGTGTLLAIDGTGNLITTSSSLNQTSTSTSGTYYLTFVSSSATGAFTPLVFSQIMCNPNVGLIEVNNIKVTSRNQGGSQVSLLARDSAGNVIDGTAVITQTASSANTDFPIGFIQFSGTGAFVPLNETSGAFTFNPSTLNLKTSKLQITSVPTGTQQYLLAVDSTGNVIQGTSAGGVTSFSAGSTGFLPNSATTGAITLSGNLNVANGGTGATTTTGTAGANVLSVSPALTGTPTAPTAGAGTNTTQIATTAFVTTAVSAVGTPTQINATTVNTSVSLYPAWFQTVAGGASTVYVETDGSLFYNPSTNRLTVPIVSASSVVETSAIQNSSGQIININAQGGAIAGNRLNLQIQSTTYYYFDKDAFYLTQPVNNVISSITNDLYILWPSTKILSLNNWVQIDNTGLLMAGTRPVFTQNVTTQATTDLNLNVPTATNFIDFNFNGLTRASATDDGLWLPSDGTRSIYFTDTAPKTGTTTYGRFFGTGATIYQDFYNQFMWRSLNLAGTSGINIMYLRNSGLNINQSSTTHTNLDAYELVVGNNSGTVNSSAKIIIRGKSTTLGYGPSIDFTAWDSHATPQASIEVLDDNNWGGVFRFKLKKNGAGSAGQLENLGYMDTNGFTAGGGIAGNGWRLYGPNGLTFKSGQGVYLQGGVGDVNSTVNTIIYHSGTGTSKWANNGWFAYGGAQVCSYDPVGNVSTGIGMGVSYDNNWCYISMVRPGNFWAQGIIETGNANWYVGGALAAYITGGGWTNVSDERCKCDINDLNTKKSLQRVLKCKPKYYKRIIPESEGTMPIKNKEEDINRIHIGLLAQEVQEFNPHCVSTWKDGDNEHEKLGIQYNDFVIHLIGAVQEQQAQIHAQQAKIEEQSQAINTLTESMKFLTEHLGKLTTAFNEMVKEK